MSDGIAVGVFSVVLAICIYNIGEHLRNMDRREKCHRCRDTLYWLGEAWRRVMKKKMPG